MKHLSLKESAYNLIKNRLLNLEFPPGTRIREDLIAEEIEMSRTPVREAINQLVSEGLIRSVPRKGLFFIELTPEEILDLIDVRGALESLAVTKCIEKIDEKGLKKLEGVILRAEECFRQGDYKKCNDLDSIFHQKIAQSTGNQKLILYLQEIEDFMHIVRTLEKRTMAKLKVERSLEQHWNIYTCIKNRDKTAAVKAVNKNIQQLRLHLDFDN
jgi:DNA-binding GntR family transcriptional regulator